jgi:hypothetical protein
VQLLKEESVEVDGDADLASKVEAKQQAAPGAKRKATSYLDEVLAEKSAKKKKKKKQKGGTDVASPGV